MEIAVKSCKSWIGPNRRMKHGISTFAALSIFLLSGAFSVHAGDAPVTFGTFTNPEPVTIQGYTGDAMEPFVSLDGNYLFFNSSNSPPAGTYTTLYYATSTDD